MSAADPSAGRPHRIRIVTHGHEDAAGHRGQHARESRRGLPSAGRRLAPVRPVRRCGPAASPRHRCWSSPVRHASARGVSRRARPPRPPRSRGPACCGRGQQPPQRRRQPPGPIRRPACATGGAVAWRARAAARPRTAGPRSWVPRCLAGPAPRARPAVPPGRGLCARRAPQLPRCSWPGASPMPPSGAWPARLRPAWPARRRPAGWPRASCFSCGTSPPPRGVYRWSTLPLAGNVNHRDQCQGAGSFAGRLILLSGFEANVG